MFWGQCVEPASKANPVSYTSFYARSEWLVGIMREETDSRAMIAGELDFEEYGEPEMDWVDGLPVVKSKVETNTVKVTGKPIVKYPIPVNGGVGGGMRAKT
jgi:hypothetical protein